ncbi:MAG: NAD(P)/FAD-dependent oxidoreductase [Bacillota bacterium]|jgi:glycerol-3-phosphate dehydrogenase|nr:NAD(P)/FAD-dependent oxidoreductase [Bacillota bacterium]
MKHSDVLVIGAGAVGNAVAREISKKQNITVTVLEKEPDVAFGISGRNSGVLHAGFNNKPGSFMARFCVMGSEGFEREAEELNLPFRRTGKLVVARFEEDRKLLLRLKEQGEANGVRELRMIEQDELEQLAGYPAGIAALWSGMTGIFDPFQYTVALAEAAASQGTEYFFGRKVVSIEKDQDFVITARNMLDGETEFYSTAVLINCAGLYADEICKMAGIDQYTIYPCRGEYHILDRKDSSLPIVPIYPIPNEKEGGLGVHLTPTADGNLMIGPSAEYLPEGWQREDYSTTGDVMGKLKREGMELLPSLERADCIRSFAGVRPKLVSEHQGGYADFVIEESGMVPGLINLVGIESPGLTASIPIGRMVAQMAAEILNRVYGDQVIIPKQSSTVETSESGLAQSSHQADSVDTTNDDSTQDHGDQKMLCRCEGITEAAVLAAYDRILKIGAITTVKGLKNRTRVTMGNCQGSFCTLNLIELLKEKRGVDPLTLLWNGFGSVMLKGSVRP